MAYVNRSFGFTERADITYTDAKPSHWAYMEVEKAMGAGYIQGNSDGTVGINKEISRQEVAVIISSLLKLTVTDNAELMKLEDASQISAWSKDDIGSVIAEKIMTGYPDKTFRASVSITRAEAIVTLNRAIEANIVDTRYRKRSQCNLG